MRVPILPLLLALGFPALGATTTATSPMPLADAVSHITAPPGFHATLFAGEPDVRQPIAMTFDDRGRLWVVENYTYTGSGDDAFDTNRRDRILIFEDSTGSGRFDKRKVFWDQGVRLTGIALGYGGVFCIMPPNLLFIPDRNGDDIPDGPPQVLLDGWNEDQKHHTIANGLKWGPDGWLYGRQGIGANSLVGRPGTPAEGRVLLNCAIWRYHPTRKVFEVVCQGGTNPWGHDWDPYGELFFVNTVIGHLWHGIPGAFYKRMFGEHNAPYRYELIDQTADHYHWNTGRSWTDSRNGAADADALGGGHAHAGLMIYQGDNWPDEYRGHVFMLNFHGRRINQDVLERNGSGYIGRHGTDLVKFGDPWFQGVDLDYGPDGGVFVLDWSDTGECHGNDGVHRETGRIYKLTCESTNNAGSLALPPPLSLLSNSLTTFPDADLLRLQFHTNEWFARHARRILQERAPALSPSFRTQVLGLYGPEKQIATKLRLLFTLHAIGGDTTDWLTAQLNDNDEHIRSWALRFLGEAPVVDWDALLPKFVEMAANDPSPFVRLYLASELQQMPKSMREPLAAALLEHAADATDHNLPLMIWYGIEPMVAQYPQAAIRLAAQSRIPLVRQFISRRLGEEISKDPNSVNTLLSAAESMDVPARRDILQGLAESLQGRHSLPKPPAWDQVRAVVEKSGDADSLTPAGKIGAVFGDSWAWQRLSKIASDKSAAPDDRRNALLQMIEARPSDLARILKEALADPVTSGVAAHGLLLLGDPNIAAWCLQRWSDLAPDDRSAMVGMMVSRATSAGLLLDAVGRGEVPRSALNAFHARQISTLNDSGLNARLAQVWGQVHASDAEKLKLIARYRTLLAPERLKQTDLALGRGVFSHTCAVCHKLYGEGAAIGPDLTGGGRASLDYLLENIVDPSAIVPEDYRVSLVELKDGRDVTALVVARTSHSLTLQTPTEKFTVEQSEIDHIRQTKLSLMPEGLLQGMKDDDICNLIAYLMCPHQVPLPITVAAKR